MGIEVPEQQKKELEVITKTGHYKSTTEFNYREKEGEANSCYWISPKIWHLSHNRISGEVIYFPYHCNWDT